MVFVDIVDSHFFTRNPNIDQMKQSVTIRQLKEYLKAK